ncbi:PIG-L family deacetylase [Panacibacter sp. DH6]|uniref:PIG-L family deacetylase n=1 Tax=Panacibacter microcysteis TaxID=2793269 RepID=A0A931E888_9BACT|nr:PIG-L family deacetylase [Panacibacter microcysteis]MBG9376969.1 PIG-L family deacetylase [Panacibacter microcysteis]
MNKLLILALTFFSISFLNTSPKKSNKTILAVVAHPDDEMSIAEVLVKYGRLGYKVFVMIATDGKYGTRVTSIPEGDSLATVRKQESTCACEKMGIEPPIFLSIDRLDTKNGVRNYFLSHKQLRESLIQNIPIINPDIIITFGPDGDTHHAEHIVIGGAVTEVILQNGWVDKYPLYYVAYDRTSPGLEAVGFMDSKYINVEITYSEEEELIGLAANKCYVSQIAPAEMQEDYDRKRKDTINKSFFRKFVIKEGRQVNFE